LGTGKIAASVLEFPDCRVEAETKEAAIDAVNQLLAEQFKNMDVMTLELPIAQTSSTNDPESESPWKKLFGLFKDDRRDVGVTIIRCHNHYGTGSFQWLDFPPQQSHSGGSACLALHEIVELR
jgi:hypothetical protein